MIRKVIVLGSGSAGLIAALGIKRRNPSLEVTVISSSLIGTIGVGEGTVPYVLDFIHNYLRLDEAATYRSLDPVYKLGVEFQWGNHDRYYYPFTDDFLIRSLPNLPRGSGYYHGAEDNGADALVAFMQAKTLPMKGPRIPNVPPPGKLVAWHIENHRLIKTLVDAGNKSDIRFQEDELESVSFNQEGNITSILGKSGQSHTADFFVDASGFRAELIGKHMETPFIPFSSSLYCDRAVVGGWDRKDGEQILSYTVSETMESGWAWRIDHPERINRGYVFSSSHLDTDAAAEEFTSKNPHIKDTREVRFKSGHHQVAWAKNVVAIGNACGFVEPLEATAIMCACLQTRWLADGLYDSMCEPTRSLRNLYNKATTGLWDEIRDFLALHYKYNKRLNTPFWQACQNDIPDTGWEDLVRFYQENGPSVIATACLPPLSQFGVPGYFAHFAGLSVPTKTHQPPRHEKRIYDEYCGKLKKLAAQGMSMQQVRECLLRPETWKKMRA